MDTERSQDLQPALVMDGFSVGEHAVKIEENGIEVFTSCQEGVCGSCVSGLLDGVADHRDHCLTAAEKAEGKQIAVCVSRAKSPRLLIELY